MTTTVSLGDDTKESLEPYRHPDHPNWSATMESIVAVLPTPEEIREEGCSNTDCEKDIRSGGGPIDEMGGFIHWFTPDYENAETFAKWFCSAECVVEEQENIRHMAGHDPDEVVIGGDDELKATVPGDAVDFYEERDHRTIILDIPGAFGGKDSHGGEYDYVGEKVHLINGGEAVRSFAIEDIVHEETSTILELKQTFGSQ